MPSQTRSTLRFDTIDVLRGISIILVVLLHTWIRTHSVGAPLRAELPPWLYHLLLQNGDNGVTIFFSVSGFLITYTSIQRFGSLAVMVPSRFYRIRFARIAPLLLLLLAVLSVLHLTHVEGFRIDWRKGETLPGSLLSALTFTLNHYEAIHGYLPASWDILWSLSVEEMFYLFFPLTCLLLGWRQGRWVVGALLLAFVAMGPLGRTIWNSAGIAQEKSYLGGMDAIAMGCATALLAVYLSHRLSQKALLALQVLGALLIFWILLWPSWVWMHSTMRLIGRAGLDGTILPLGTCLVIFGSVLRNRAGRIWTAPIRWFGRHSYEVYLTHEFLVVFGTELLLKLKRGPLALWFVAILLATAPVGWLVARFYTEPLNRRLRRIQMRAMPKAL